MAMTLEEALMSGDPEALEAAMAADEAEGNAAPDNGESEAAAADDAGDDKGGVTPPQGDVEQKPVVLTRDGKHAIPYEVLESTRAELASAKERLAELTLTQQKLEELEAQKRAVEEQLARHNIELPKSAGDITDEQLEALDDYGEVGPLVRALVMQQRQLAQQLGAAREQFAPGSAAEVEYLIARDPDLSVWQESDPDRWALAVQHDKALRQDPEWQRKSTARRLVEVARLVKRDFGEVKPSPSPEITPATVQPASLSDFGRADAGERPLTERLSDLSADELVQRMASMTPAEIDKLLFT